MENKLSNLYKKLKFTSLEAEKEVNKLKPQSKNEFLQLNVIDEIFIENNLNVINEIERYCIKRNNFSLVDEKLLTRLNLFNEKLKNISQKNSIIWNLGEVKTRNIDLFNLSNNSFEEVIKLINNSETTKVVPLYLNDDIIPSGIKGNEKRESFKSKYFSQVIRTNQSQIQEKGINNLYIAKYYFNGKINLQLKNIYLRAPIFLYPVKLIEDKDKTYLQRDNGRDVFVNDFIIENILEESFEYNENQTSRENLKELISLFKDYEVRMDWEEKEFEHLTLKDLKYKTNDFFIANNTTVGVFNTTGNAIRNEIIEMIEDKNISDFLGKVLSDRDIHSKNDLSAIDRNFKRNINSDINLYNYNYLNFSQMEALKKINDNNLKGLTVWGPPGTGKSELIISIIQDAVAKGKRVAVVSEKQAALQVIRERLDVIRDSSVIVSDTKNKDEFYNQINTAINRTFEKVYKSNYHSRELKKIYDKYDNFYSELTMIINKSRHVISIQEINKMFFTDGESLNLDQIDGMMYDPIIRNLDASNLSNYFTYINLIDQIVDVDWVKKLLKIKEDYKPSYEKIKEIENEYKEKINYLNDEVKKIYMEKSFMNEIMEMLIELYNSKLLWNVKRRREIRRRLKTDFYYTDKLIKKFIKRERMNHLNELETDLNERLETLRKGREFLNTNQTIFETAFATPNNILNLFKLINLNDDNIEFQKSKLKNSIKFFFLEENDELRKINELQNSFDGVLNREKGLLSYINDQNKLYVLDSLNKNFFNNFSSNQRREKIIKVIERKNKPQIKEFMDAFTIEMRNSIPVWLIQADVIPTLFNRNEEFDIVIFDEASQIFIEKSLPGISRAKKLVVLGDEKQLGPSNFFDGRIDKEDDEIESDESLLTFAKAKFPTVMLRNHYRSEHVSLIDFSNENYYNDELIFIDKKESTRQHSAVEFIPVKRSQYNNSINNKEAEVVLQTLLDKFESKSNNTLGIITTNVKQADLIEDKILNQDQAFRDWLTKTTKYFCKSIENVQGDERDEIIFATTFGPNELGVQNVNFGPINNSQGSNRINVAVTRAKKKMTVISSIDIEQAKRKVKTSKNSGPRDFISFIEYARDINEIKQDLVKGKVDNEITFANKFEEQVFNEIKADIKKDFKLDIITQYKVLGYKIDFVLVNARTKEPILALELDNNSAKGSKSTRENDFYRESFLNQRGWNTYRIWSSNWWRNMEVEKKKLYIFIKDIING